jgi:hypothetical protein
MKSFPRKYFAISCSLAICCQRGIVAHLVPESDISSTVIDDGPQLAVLLEIVHECLQSVNTVDKVNNSLFVMFLVQGLPDIVDGFTENGRESDTHSSLLVSGVDRKVEATYVSEGVLMVSSVCRSVRVECMGEEAYMRAKEAGLIRQLCLWVHEDCDLLGLTREGVRGYCSLVSLYSHACDKITHASACLHSLRLELGRKIAQVELIVSDRLQPVYARVGGGGSIVDLRQSSEVL